MVRTPAANKNFHPTLVSSALALAAVQGAGEIRRYSYAAS